MQLSKGRLHNTCKADLVTAKNVIKRMGWLSRVWRRKAWEMLLSSSKCIALKLTGDGLWLAALL